MMNTCFTLMYMFMIFMMFFLMIFPSTLYKFHPLILSLLLIFYILILCFMMNFLKHDYFYSYILFLMMVGGLMILFMYFTSLTASNQLFYMKMDYYFFGKLFFFSVTTYLFLSEDMMKFIMNFMNFEICSFNQELFMNKLDLKNLLMDYYLHVTLFIILYMFMMMICSVLVCMKFFLPLRQLVK